MQNFLTFFIHFLVGCWSCFAFVVISLNHNWFALRFYVDLCVYNIYVYIYIYMLVCVAIYIYVYNYVCSIPYAQMNFPFSELISFFFVAAIFACLIVVRWRLKPDVAAFCWCVILLLLLYCLLHQQQLDGVRRQQQRQRRRMRRRQRHHDGTTTTENWTRSWSWKSYIAHDMAHLHQEFASIVVSSSGISLSLSPYHSDSLMKRDSLSLSLSHTLPVVRVVN